MEVDPNSLDPELRMAKFYALASAALGLISLCAAMVPACGGIASLLGMVLGWISLKTEYSRTAAAGIAISILGLLITVIYVMFLLFFKQ